MAVGEDARTRWPVRRPRCGRIWMSDSAGWCSGQRLEAENALRHSTSGVDTPRHPCCGWAGPGPDPVAGWTGLFRKPQRRKAMNDRRRLHAHSDQALDKVDDVPWLASSGCPVAGVVDDAAGLVGLDLIALHDPLDGRLAVDLVLVCLWRDTAEGQRAVVDDRGLVHDRSGFAEPHLGDMQVHVATHPAAVLVQRPGLDGFVVEMPGGQVTSGLAETPEVLDHRNTRDHLLQVSGEAFLVLRRVQHSVDIVEDVDLLDVVAVPAAVVSKCGVRDRIHAGVSVLVAFVKQDGILANPVVVVQREALALFD